LVERWFKELTDKKLRRSSFTSVDQLIDTIDQWAEHWNENPSRSSGTAAPRRSSPKSAEGEQPSLPPPNPRRTTS